METAEKTVAAGLGKGSAKSSMPTLAGANPSAQPSYDTDLMKKRYFLPLVWICLALISGYLTGLLLASRSWALHMPEKQTLIGGTSRAYAFMQVTVRHPLNFLDTVALIWCFLPFVVPFMFFLWWAATFNFFPMYALSVAVFCVVLNELLLKHIFKQPRPPESAAQSWGFPSGHVLNAYALQTWLLLELTISGGQVSPADWDNFLITVVIFAPTPWARWHNQDHSLKQCVFSILLGGIIGVLAFVVRRTVHPELRDLPFGPEPSDLKDTLLLQIDGSRPVQI